MIWLIMPLVLTVVLVVVSIALEAGDSDLGKIQDGIFKQEAERAEERAEWAAMCQRWTEARQATADDRAEIEAVHRRLQALRQGMRGRARIQR